jgi:L-fuconolactonase
MDIVDSQIHLFLTMNADAAIAAMNSIGIQAALIDEFWGYEGDSHDPPPGYAIPGGVFRPIAPGATMASMKHPDRFSWLLRVDPRDPDLDSLMGQVKVSSEGRALRLEARSEQEVRSFAAGDCMVFFHAAQKHDLPVFILSPGNSALLEPYVRDCPDLRVVIDHCGLPREVDEYNQVLALAKYPNVFLKWCHAPRVFRAPKYPFPEVMPYLARSLDAFGRERIMWGSDFTAIRTGHTWADTLFYLRDNAGLSEGDKEWLLGRTIRTVLDWPAPAQLRQPALHRH